MISRPSTLRPGRPDAKRRICPAVISAASWRSSTTPGSRSVVTSPSSLPAAMSRSRRRMILPERVFGRSSAKAICFGRASLPIFSATWSRSSASSSSPPSTLALGRDEGEDRLARVLVGDADHRRLGDALVADQRRLDLHRREPVAGDVDHVVDPADDPEVAVLVAPGGVADEVGVLAEPLPVGLDEALAAPCRACAPSTATAGSAPGSRRPPRPRCPRSS